jgi:hypothetical protein
MMAHLLGVVQSHCFREHSILALATAACKYARLFQGSTPAHEHLSMTAQALSEAHVLLVSGDYNQAATVYEQALRTHPDDVRATLKDRANYQRHKEFLKCRLVLQMLAQANLENGFYVNYGPYLFTDKPLPDVCVSASAIQAVNRYKKDCASIEKLKQGVLERVANHPQATTLLYYAHSVASDIVDLFIVSANFPMARLADIGCGAGLQAATLAKLNPGIERVYLIEEQDFMQEAAAEAFIANGLNNFCLNRELEAPIDGFYSFRACGFLFSVELYVEQIRRARGPASWALMDIADRMDIGLQRRVLMSTFTDATVLYDMGTRWFRHDRTLFDGTTV